MEIPLDYYRILGVPIQANDKLLIQAYRDRSLQLPRSEYSKYAIAARKKLLEKAYEFLSQPQNRIDYNAQFFPTQNLKSNINEVDTESESSQPKDLLVSEEAFDQENQITLPRIEPPSLDIDEDLLIGALLILHELGEYELVLRLTRPYIEEQKQLKFTEDVTQKIQATWNDLILVNALSYVELSKEQWQLGEYLLAFQSQKQALSSLVEEKLFPDLQAEITRDLQKLRPYLIVDILSDQKEDNHERQKAIKFLKDILDERDGIEGKGLDNTGLTLEDFLRFIQQVRVYLTVSEQQQLFEEEAKRPSIAASYLAVYALIARGFSERKPAYIVRAKNALISLTETQNVYLEQSICALLLGQTEEAQFALQQSNEEEAINYIRNHSQNSPDLLPGLCLYTEKWLQTELFPQFSNLNNQVSSLKDYFASNLVQNYLEDLYVDSSDSVKQNNVDSSPEIAMEENTFSDLSNLESEPNYSEYQGEKLVQVNKEQNIDHVSEDDAITLTFVDAKRDTDFTNNEDLVPFDSFLNSNLEEHNYSDKTLDYHRGKSSVSTHDIRQRKSKNRVKNRHENLLTNILKSKKLLWLIVCLIFFSILAVVFYKVLTSKKDEKLILSINKPLVQLPQTNTATAPSASETNLDKQRALEIVQAWLSAKSKALGPDYNISDLEKVLSEPMLSTWKNNTDFLVNRNAYRRYKHDVSIESVSVNPNNPDQAIIIAEVSEVSQYYQNGILNAGESYNDVNLKVKYDMIKRNNKWLIKGIQTTN